MPQHKHIIDELLDNIDTIRPTLLNQKEQDNGMRSLLRRMVSLLESLQNTPSVDPHLYQHITHMFALLLDAEHGTLLKHLYLDEQNKEALNMLGAHIKTRKILIDAAQQDLPSALTMIRRGFDLLGKPHPSSDDLSVNFKQFTKHLQAYLQGNSKVRLEFNLLTSALKQSVQAMDHVLNEVGSHSPELKEVQSVLEQDLPSDPEQAQALLRNARNNILKAGDKLNHASQQVKVTMTAQVAQMDKLAKRLHEAEAQARNDPLTGLGNRRKLREFFNALRKDTSTSFLMIDIDHFKYINDQYGHDAGDLVLKRLGSLLKVAVRSTDMAARLGGEEFCIVLPETNRTQASNLAEKIRHDIETETFRTQHGNIDVKVSIGVAERLDEEPIAQWLKRADTALYQAKGNGRNQVVNAE